MTDAHKAEEQFYSRYSWCLNAPLSVEDLLIRFREELDRYETLDGWQREESRANLYLFVCAVACTVDDYFSLSWLNFPSLSKRFPQLRGPITIARAVLDVAQAVVKAGDRVAWRWRRRWDECIARACCLLMCNPMADREELETLRSLSIQLATAKLPNALLKRRMRLPEAFRCQDMTHHDVISLISRFCVSFSPSDRPLVIMGLRSAGAYFAPLMAEFLKTRRWSSVSWFSIRPKNGLAGWEKQQLRTAANENAHLLLVDDYPSTGHTLRITLELLSQCGIRADQIAVLAPTHPAQPHWVQLAGIDPRIPVFTIHSSDLFKTALLAPDHVEAVCQAYYSTEGVDVHVIQDKAIDDLNVRLAEHSKDGHHVRDKRVFALEFSKAGESPRSKKILFKSVGWGWLGYHAYIAGMRLHGFVPRVIGLRDGLLAMEWIDRTEDLPQSDSSAQTVKLLGAYTAARARRLALSGDCRFEKRTYRYTGSDEMLNIIRAVYGSYINRLKTPALRKELHKYAAAMPTLIDSRMQPDEWICTSEGTYKGDFEHHTFGGAEQDIVDPAYDLAAAIFEFGLNKGAEQELLGIYREESSDTSIDTRILLHKLLYGSLVMRYTLANAASGKEPDKNNARHQGARDFLVYSMNDYCAKLIGATKQLQWSDDLFFLDLDGVFDQELLGFPHATQSGLVSLSLLRSHGFSVVINTGRSIQHVRRYCDAYGLPGGIAEFGAVFVDAVHQRELPLIDEIGSEQLVRCREALKEIPGVFVDPGYEYSIRAYRYNRSGTIGLSDDELKQLLRGPEFSHLTYIRRDPDSYIVQKRTGKGTALRFVRREVGSATVPVSAIGESKFDIGMLKAAEFAYAPANCAPAMRDLARQGQCRILRQQFQNGLLAAVRHRLRQKGAHRVADSLKLPAGADHLNSLMQSLLKAADRHIAIQILVILSWWSL